MKGVKNFSSAFLVHRLNEHNEMRHDEGHLCVPGLLLFRQTGPLFREHKFSSADIWTLFVGARRNLDRRVTKFGMVVCLAS